MSEPLLRSSLDIDDDEPQRHAPALRSKRWHDPEYNHADEAATHSTSRRIRDFLRHPHAIFTLTVASLIIAVCLWLHRIPPLDLTISRNTHLPKPRHFFLFGDSYSKTLFDAAGEPPSHANPIGNPTLARVVKTTSSGGPNWAVLLATRYNTSLTFLYDYAYGGATIDKRIIPPPHNSPIHDFSNQVKLFHSSMGREGAPSMGSRKDAVFGVWFGQNDVDQVYNRTFASPNATFERAFDTYISNVIDLWNAGARHFLFVGVAPIMRSPMVRTEQDGKAIGELSTMFNKQLQARVEAFAQQHEGMSWDYYDPAPAFQRVLDHPKAYGIVNTKCFSPDGISCAWWDHFHPGVRIHEQIAEDVAKMNLTLFAPLNISDRHDDAYRTNK